MNAGTPANLFIDWYVSILLAHRAPRNSTEGKGERLVSSRWADHTCGYERSVIASARRQHLAREDSVPNRAVHHFGKFTSERDAIDWINAHPRLTKPEDTMD
jgi:hypothetical protein